jgi:hypothetical protein
VTTLPDVARPALVSLQKEIDQVGEKMGAREAERMTKKMEEAAKLKAGLGANQGKQGAADAGKKDQKFTTQGLEEFQRSLQEGVFGKDQVQKDQLAVQQQQLVVQQQQLEEAKKASRKGPGAAVAV